MARDVFAAPEPTAGSIRTLRVRAWQKLSTDVISIVLKQRTLAPACHNNTTRELAHIVASYSITLNATLQNLNFRIRIFANNDHQVSI
jgi:hypothetical protein